MKASTMASAGSIVALGLVACAVSTGDGTSSAEPVADIGGTATAPTPYTAGQIRRTNPPGTRLVFRIEQPERATVLQVIEFVGGDEQQAVMEIRILDERGEMLGEPDRSTATWTELRDHAAFPAADSHRVSSTCTVPPGTYDTWLYTVHGEDEDGPFTSRYQFADECPGPPVLLETERAGEIAFRMILVEDSRR